MDAVNEACAERGDDKDRPVRVGRGDTALRCAIALVVVRVGMRMVETGAKMTSEDHHARRVHETAVQAWRERTRRMPWRGFVPTRRSPVTITQALWVTAALLAIDTLLYMVDLPHIPLDGLLRHHVPHLVVGVHAPPDAH